MESPFVGDSEMARRMREVDWAGTPLGPPAGWPPALRTAVELLLRSQLPMYVAAGPQWSLLYNDAYAPMLGARHPDALAAAFADAWPEVWPGLQPVLADALAGKAVFQESMPMLLARRGWPEEAWFTYSLSAIGGEESGADGVFCACTETTAQVVGERRLRALGELAELGSATDVEAAGAAAVEVLSRYRADVPAALLYLLGDDGARLVAAEGVEPGGALAPGTVGDDGFWAPVLREVVSSGHSAVVEGLAATLPAGRLPGAGPLHPGLLGGERHDERPFDAAVVLPVRIGAGGLAAVLVAGVSPYLPLDEEYRAFLELVGHHLSTAATAADAFAAQQRRAEHLAELDRAKTAFFARISDEFRTPLTLVLGPVAELRDATTGPAATPPDDGGDPPSAVPPDNADAGRILVVDDHADMRAYLVRLLGRTHRVEAAADGAAALVAAVADPPDLVLADVSLPGLSGLDLLTALRGDPRTSLVPVVLMSARAGPEAAVEGLGAGADDYLVTPFSARELRARVDGRVALGRARREAERRFRAMADSTPALIWADGPGGRRLFVNRGWLEFTGAEPDADLGLAWQDRIHPADRAHYSRVRAAADGGPFEVEYRLRAANGHYRWVLDCGAPAEGYVGGYVGGCLDIDSRVGERERQRLLAVIGAALDRETTVTGRRQTLVRTLVDEGLADMARFVEISDGQATDGLAIAAHTPEQEAVLRGLDVDWMQAGRTVTAGEVRQYDVDEAFILASSTDERQRELRRSMRFGTVALVPLSARGQTSGLLAVARTRGSTPFDDGDITLLADLAERAATALDNALLLEREQANRARLEVLQRATAALSAAATPEQVAATAVQQFAGLARATVVTLWRLTGVGGDAVLEPAEPPVSAPGRRIAVGDPVPPAEAARTRGPVWAEDGDPGTVDCIPLVAAGTCVGVVGLGGQPRDVRTGAARAALTVLAKLCAQALQRAGLLAAESAARRTAEEFGEVVGALSGATRLVDVAEVVLDHTVRLGASSAAVLLRAGEHLDVLAARGTDAVPATARRLPLDSGHPAAHAARTGEPLWEDGRGPDTGTLVAVPLALGGPTQPTGAIVLRFADGRPSFSAQERAAVLTLAGQCAQALDRARLHQAEHDVADVLQRSLLPPALPPLPRLRVAARYLPSAVGIAAGGDWYDLLPIDENRVAVVVGDVVGHGATAAAVMGQLRSALAAYLLDGHSPAAALERLDRFARRVPGSAGSTCVCLVVDCGTGALCWASAGHPPVLLLEPAGPRYLDEGGGTVLGVAGRPAYRQADAVIEPGSSVLLYTDGLVERRGEVLDEGQARLARAAARVRDLPPDELVSAVVDTALADGALGDAAAPDDIAVVAVRLVPGALHGVQPAQPRRLRVMRRAVEDWAAAVGLPDEVLDDLQYALGEAAANAVEHAYGNTGEGEFRYTLEHRSGPDGGVAVEVRDTGRWRPVPADSGHRGRGVAVLHAVGKDVRIDSGDDGTTVTFQVPVPPADAPRRPRVATHTRSAGPTTVTAVPGTDPPVLRVSGDLDLDGVATVRAALLAAPGPAGLVVDLHDTGYVSSAGVALLVELSTRARTQGAPLALRVSVGSPVARVLDLTGLRAVLPVDS